MELSPITSSSFSRRLERPLERTFRREDFLMVKRLGGFGAEPRKLAFIE